MVLEIQQDPQLCNEKRKETCPYHPLTQGMVWYPHMLGPSPPPPESPVLPTEPEGEEGKA